MQFRTHYDNLKVARNAPPEVIIAAYRALSRKLHPDVSTHPDAAKFMAIVNDSYSVLSDPSRKAVHDAWIAQQERPPYQYQGHTVPVSGRYGQDGRGTVQYFFQRYWLVLLFVGFFGWIFLQSSGPAPRSSLPSYDRAATTEAVALKAIEPAAYVRPSMAPNGKPWPSSAGYVAGYKRLRTDGLSQLTVDNSETDSDMFVKLVAIDARKTLPVRQFYLPQGSSLTLNSIRAGDYDLRYLDLANGSLTRSEQFTLQEIREPDGIRFSQSTVTLYKVTNGNFQSYPLSLEEF